MTIVMTLGLGLGLDSRLGLTIRVRVFSFREYSFLCRILVSCYFLLITSGISEIVHTP